MGILVKNEIAISYKISGMDTSADGIIGLQFKHYMSEYCFIIFSVTFPQKVRLGLTPNVFFSHLLMQFYSHNLLEADAVSVCGDLNSRTLERLY